MRRTPSLNCSSNSVAETSTASSSRTVTSHTSSIRGRKSISGFKSASVKRALGRKASLSSLMDNSNTESNALGSPGMLYNSSTATSRARVHYHHRSTTRVHPSSHTSPSSSAFLLEHSALYDLMIRNSHFQHL